MASQPECTNGQYYPSSEGCNKFYICVNGQRVEQHCASGLVWNPDTSQCDWGFNVKCGEGDRGDGDERELPWARPGSASGPRLPCALSLSLHRGATRGHSR